MRSVPNQTLFFYKRTTYPFHNYICPKLTIVWYKASSKMAGNLGKFIYVSEHVNSSNFYYSTFYSIHDPSITQGRRFLREVVLSVYK